MNTELLIIIITAFCFGLSQKLADLFDEHGWITTKPIRMILGLVWGVIGSFLVLVNVYSALVICATVLYWLFRVKLDYTNHTVAGSLVLLVSIYEFGKYPSLFPYLVYLFIWLSLTGTISSFLRKKFPHSRILRLRLWIYLGPFLVSCLLGNYIPFITTLFGMLGTELIAYKQYKSDMKNLGVAVKPILLSS